VSEPEWFLIVVWVLGLLAVIALAVVLISWFLRRPGVRDAEDPTVGTSYPDQGSGPAGWWPGI
jgi:hypothetical protein